LKEQPMPPTLVLIHGMFVNPLSWEAWQRYFETMGMRCIAPAWPYHEGEPARLRADVPPRLGELSLQSVTQAIEIVVARYDHPVLVGHSLGGLVVQRLIAARRGSLGITLCSVAPNAMVSLDWGLLRTGAEIANPLKGDQIHTLDRDTFHERFANKMTREEAMEAYERYVLPESRNVVRDALGEPGQVDVDRAHAPLLFIAAGADRVIPPELVQKNAAAYTHRESIVEVRVFEDRCHFIQAQRGWETVAAYIVEWIARHSGAATDAAVR
jgi:alpha-beta hydrolase superfamily lysophospholipase